MPWSDPPPGEAVIPVLLQKIRSGLVELRTKSGLVYVNPSFSERLYLLWTFRNFHRLPLQVLNRRQQQVVERLGQTAVVAKSDPVPRNHLIGSVENIEVSVVSEAKAAAGTGKVVSIGAPLSLMGKAAGSEEIVTRRRRLKLPHHPIRFPGKSRRAQDISSHEKEVPAEAQARRRQARRFPRILEYQGNWKSLGIGLLVAGCLALLLLWSREERAFSSRLAPQAAPRVRNTPRVSSVSTYVAEPDKVQSPVAAQAAKEVKTAKTIAVDLVSSPTSAEIHAPGELSKSVVSTPPPVNPAQLDTVHRPHISEWPEDGFSYPIAPRRNLTGTVLLRAVIGINGTVTRVDILSGDRSLASAAAAAVEHWRYPPPKLKGIPAEVETNVVINFRGDDAVSISVPAI